MAYTEPYIDATGMYVPTYADIRDNLIEQMKQIFGEDIYIAEDTQDYQQISVLAKKIYDVNSLAMLVYNNRTPNTAIGVGLDNLCSLVGIDRKLAQYSTVQLTITGTPGTVIQNGVASDGTYDWNLPDEVTIPEAGQIIVEAQCSIPGNITAGAGTITEIETPVYGWTSVTNTYAVSGTNIGSNEESDAELRGRFANAASLPSSSIFEGMIAAVQDVSGVTRSKGYENDTGSVSSEGFPPHSVTFVVEGGSDEDIADAIYFKKTPGCYTNGTTSVQIISMTGNVTTVRFYRPTYKPVYVKVNITPLAGYTDDYATQIKNALADYINGLQISDTLYISVLMSVAIGQMGSITSPEFAVTSVQISQDGSTWQSTDLAMNFNEVSTVSLSNIQVVVA